VSDTRICRKPQTPDRRATHKRHITSAHSLTHRHLPRTSFVVGAGKGKRQKTAKEVSGVASTDKLFAGTRSILH
jgi:hypothetical protein